eukprot:4201355-Amphidinium_carterae.4
MAQTTTRSAPRRTTENRSTKTKIPREEEKPHKTTTPNAKATLQSPPGLEQPKPEVYKAALPPTEAEPKHVTEEVADQSKTDEPRRRLTKKTPMTGLQATMDTGSLYLTVNEDNEERRLATESMNLQVWYDDENTEYAAQELKGAIKEVFQKVERSDDTQDQLRQVIRTKWVIRRRPGDNKNKRLKARLVAKAIHDMSTQMELYAATPAAVTCEDITLLGTDQEVLDLPIRHCQCIPQYTSTEGTEV